MMPKLRTELATLKMECERLDMEKLLDITNTEEAFDWHEWNEEETEVVLEIEPTEDLEFNARSSALTSNVEKMIRNVEDLDIMKLKSPKEVLAAKPKPKKKEKGEKKDMSIYT